MREMTDKVTLLHVKECRERTLRTTAREETVHDTKGNCTAEICCREHEEHQTS